MIYRPNLFYVRNIPFEHDAVADPETLRPAFKTVPVLAIAIQMQSPFARRPFWLRQNLEENVLAFAGCLQSADTCQTQLSVSS